MIAAVLIPILFFHVASSDSAKGDLAASVPSPGEIISQAVSKKVSADVVDEAGLCLLQSHASAASRQPQPSDASISHESLTPTTGSHLDFSKIVGRESVPSVHSAQRGEQEEVTLTINRSMLLAPLGKRQRVVYDGIELEVVVIGSVPEGGSHTNVHHAVAERSLVQNLDGKQIQNSMADIPDPDEKVGSIRFWAIVLASVVLVLFAGLMSGLSIGLLSFQPMDLEVVERSAQDEQQRKMAQDVKTVISDQHYLLVTLLICNAAAMEGLPVLLDDVMSPVAAVILSVTAVLVFGEILPQAICKSFGLTVGAKSATLVKFLMVLCAPVAWPVAKLLDKMFGHDTGPLYTRRAEVASLVAVETEHGVLSENEALVMQGALAMADKRCGSCLTPQHEICSLDCEAKLDEANMSWLLKTGRSRIPVIEKDGSVSGMLLIKKFIKLRPEDATPVRKLVQSPVMHVSEDTYLFDLLEIFHDGRSHMAVVYDRNAALMAGPASCPQGARPVGIVTLTDVIEELIRSEIKDETDVASRHGSFCAVDLLDIPLHDDSSGTQVPSVSGRSGRSGRRVSMPAATSGLVNILRQATSVGKEKRTSVDHPFGTNRASVDNQSGTCRRSRAGTQP